jgi:hypothetical protein
MINSDSSHFLGEFPVRTQVGHEVSLLINAVESFG